MKYEKESRLASYAAIACVPAMGVAGVTVTALAGDIIHYGGPAIVIDRSHFSSHQSGNTHFSYSAGYGGIFSQGSDGGQGSAKNFGAVRSNSVYGSATAVRGAKLGMNFGSSVTGFALGTKGAGLLKMVNASEQIELGNFKANTSIAKVAMSARFTSATTITSSTQIGDWAVDSEGNETRGYAAFGIWTDDMEDPDFGWMDIGWDGHSLTIYDWALNTDGSIHVGQTTSAVPGATGLAALAMGAAGLRRRRKRAA